MLEQRKLVIAPHKTTFVGAHVAAKSEELGQVSALLDRCPDLYVDISACISELRRQSYSARDFVLKYADCILFGTDLLPSVEMYRLYFRFLETADAYFEDPSHASRQGRCNIYGIFLPDEVLCKVYRENALKLNATSALSA